MERSGTGGADVSAHMRKRQRVVATDRPQTGVGVSVWYQSAGVSVCRQNSRRSASASAGRQNSRHLQAERKASAGRTQGVGVSVCRSSRRNSGRTKKATEAFPNADQKAEGRTQTNRRRKMKRHVEGRRIAGAGRSPRRR